MTRSLPIRTILRAALPGCLLLAACVNDEEAVRTLVTRKPGVDEATGIVSYMSQSGRMRARLTAPVMLRYQDTLPRMEFPKTLHVDFYDSLLSIQNTVDARYARYLEMQNKVLLRDSVRVYNRQGDTLFCQELWWDQAAEKFHTDKPVRINRPGTIINGVGLTAPQDFATFTIFQITNSLLRVEGGIEGAAAPATPDPSVRRPPPVPLR